MVTAPTARLNAYNRHALAPWIEETGYITPLYLHRREQERLPFNMGRWLNKAVSECMLYAPTLVLRLDDTVVKQLLEIAARCQYSVEKAKKHTEELSRIAKNFPALPASQSGYFIRLSESSPKDVDDGDLLAVHTISEALQKLVCSKRSVQALLALHADGEATIDNQLYFFPYHSSLDHLNEWRCYIHNDQVVAISQSRFYQPQHEGVTDDSLRRMTLQVRQLWEGIRSELNFTSCVLDVYAEVHRPEFETKLIEINPYHAHVGSGSLLFHWIDDSEILLDSTNKNNSTVVRLVLPNGKDGEPPLGRKEAYEIGRAGILQDEIEVLQKRGLEWILEPEHHKKFMQLPVPGQKAGDATTTRQAKLEKFCAAFVSRDNAEKEKVEKAMREGQHTDHPRFRKLQKLYLEQKDSE